MKIELLAVRNPTSIPTSPKKAYVDIYGECVLKLVESWRVIRPLVKL